LRLMRRVMRRKQTLKEGCSSSIGQSLKKLKKLWPSCKQTLLLLNCKKSKR